MHPIALMQSMVTALQGAFAGDGVACSAMAISAQSPSGAFSEELADETDNGIACTVAPIRKAKPVSTSTTRLRTATTMTGRR
jgi:hypothetical protein